MLEETRRPTKGVSNKGTKPAEGVDSGVLSHKASTKKQSQAQLKNKEANFIETMERFPEAKEMMNMRLKNAPYKDPYDQVDPHRPSRLLNNEVPSTVKKLEHNYSKKVKKHLKSSLERVGK